MIPWIILWMNRLWEAGLLTTRLILNLGSSRIQQQLFHSIIQAIRRSTCIAYNLHCQIIFPLTCLMQQITIRARRTCKMMHIMMSQSYLMSQRKITSHIWLAISSQLEASRFQTHPLKIGMSIILRICHL